MKQTPIHFVRNIVHMSITTNTLVLRNSEVISNKFDQSKQYILQPTPTHTPLPPHPTPNPTPRQRKTLITGKVTQKQKSMQQQHYFS
jgi:hypothetical protein